uniref:Fibronectin type-III domain-containing protein n=1 Tax=Hucho hucho TaxID=62062 RepID=A0A4W5Q5W0_9TELE
MLSSFMNFMIMSLSVSPFVILALCTLPAPVNVTIDSLNFHHVLRWIPGPGTPPGTMYKILRRENNNKALQLRHQTNMTNQKLDLKYPKETYRFCVQASHDLLESPLAGITFIPFTQTVIGPPTLSLDGCGNCLVINITLPEMGTIQNVYGNTVSFQIYWKRAGETQFKETRTTNLSYMLENLKVGVEYCVRVHTVITTNRKTQLSEWKCAHTSIVEPNRVPAVLAGVSVLLIVSGAGLMVLMFVLFYTGFLCKLKTHLPRSLTAQVEGYLVTPERTVSDLVSISSEPEEQWKALRPKAHPNRENSNRAGEEEEEEDDEEEEEEGGNGVVYMDCDVGLFFDSSSSTTQSQEASGANVALNGAGHSGGLSFEAAAEEEEEAPVGMVVLGGQCQREVKGELAKVISSLDGDQPRPLGLAELGGQEEKEMREVAVELEEEKEMREETSGNVNLFSVTLGALKREEEEEEEHDNETDVLLGCSKQEQNPLLPIDSLQRTLGLGSMGSQGEEEEEEEEGGNDYYMDCAAKLSCKSSSSTTQSQDASGTNVALLNAVGHSGGLSSEAAAEEEEDAPVGVVVLGGQGQSEVKGELVKVISSLDRDQPRPLGLVGLGGEEEKEVREEVREEMSINVNLFSVTLEALKREDENETDVLLGCSKQEQKPLLTIDSLQRTLGLDSMGSKGEIQEDTGLVLTPPQTDCTHKYSEYSDRPAVSCRKTYSDCLVTHTGTVQSHSETEEEEDFSGYMGH